MEYVTVVEGARRLGISEKTIRRAIHAKRLPARYPRPNRCEIAVSDLEVWRRPPAEQDATDHRLAELESRVNQLEQQVQYLLEALRFEPVPVVQPSPRKVSAHPEGETPPEGFVWLHDFADRHFVSRNEADRLYQTGMIHGQKISVSKRRAPVAIGPRGRRDFYTQFHQTHSFRSCDECPHEESE